MKYRIIAFAVLIWLIHAGAAIAATNVVVLGADFQQAINAAASGDTLVVQSGAYAGNLSFDRSLTLLCSGAQIQFAGNILVTNNATVAFPQSTFAAGFLVATNAGAIVSQCSFQVGPALAGGTLQAYDSQFPGITSSGGKLTLKRCNINGDINLANTAFEGLRITNTGSFNATAPMGSGTRFVIVQSVVYFMTVSGFNAWAGYNTITGGVGFNNSDSVVIGNQANIPAFGGTSTAMSFLNGKARIYNNAIQTSSDNNNKSFYGIYLSGIFGEIVNNSIKIYHYDTVVGGSSYTRAIWTDAACSLVIRANITMTSAFHGAGYIDDTGVEAPASAVSNFNYNDILNLGCCGPGWSGGVGVATLVVDPLFNSDLSLQTNSPCIHAGPPDPVYNNTDGTRNTMGYTGGPFWNPINYTNNNPMVFWLSTTNQIIQKGTQSTVRITVGASAGH